MATEDATAAAGDATVASGGPASARPGGPSPDRGGFARWWAGWRVAIRVARRDARRYKWRSALIVAMVGLPVLLLTSGIILISTEDVSVAESVPRVMGSAQARIDVSSADPSGSNGTVARVPGFALNS